MNEPSDSPPNPHKFRLHEADNMGFDDANQPIGVTWPEGFEAPEEIVLDALEDCPTREAKADTLAAALDLAGYRRAREVIEMIISGLPGGRRGDELRAVFFGSVDGESLEVTASRHGVDRSNWFRNVDRLRKCLLRKMDNKKPIGEDMKS